MKAKATKKARRTSGRRKGPSEWTPGPVETGCESTPYTERSYPLPEIQQLVRGLSKLEARLDFVERRMAQLERMAAMHDLKASDEMVEKSDPERITGVKAHSVTFDTSPAVAAAIASLDEAVSQAEDAIDPM